MSYDVREVGNAILEIADEAGISLTNLALNKILYFSHAWFMVQYSRPLIASQFEAWQYGPVSPVVYRQLKKYGDKKISGKLTKIDSSSGEDVVFKVNVSPEDFEFIKKIALFYSNFSASKLVDMSHEPGAPWDRIWSEGESVVKIGMTIPDELTEDYYRRKRM